MRRTMLGILLVLAAVSPLTSAIEETFRFSLDSVEEGNVVFRGEAGCPWKSVGYTGDCFLVWRSGVQGVSCNDPETAKPGMVVQLAEDGKSLRLICRAEACQVKTTDAVAKVEERKLETGGETTVPTTSHIEITVGR